jgi:hypothetical protein
METFVLRVRPAGEPFAEPADDYPADIEGSVEHVGYGKATTFSCGDQLLASLLTAIDQAAREPLVSTV